MSCHCQTFSFEQVDPYSIVQKYVVCHRYYTLVCVNRRFSKTCKPNFQRSINSNGQETSKEREREDQNTPWGENSWAQVKVELLTLGGIKLNVYPLSTIQCPYTYRLLHVRLSLSLSLSLFLCTGINDIF